MALSTQELSSLATWYPAPPFFAPGAQTTFSDDDLQQLLWIYRVLDLVEGVFSGIIHAPLILFVAPGRLMAVSASVDLLSFSAPFRPMTVAAVTRALEFTTPPRAMAVAATIDTLSFPAPSRPMAVMSSARGGG